MTPGATEAYRRSLELLSAAATPHGFVASPSFDHYAAIWGRDGLISALGGIRSGAPGLVDAAAATLDTLAEKASDLGQIPAFVAPAREEWDFGEGGAVDVTAWFVVVADAYLDATGDTHRAGRWWDAAVAAVRWLRHQDVTGSGLISAAPSTDWMDAALTRSGRTLHLNVLYAWAESALERLGGGLGRPVTGRGDRVREAVNAWFWPERDTDVPLLFPHGFAHDATRIAYWEAAGARRRFYLSHIVHAAFVDRCDVLANLLAIRAGIAGPERAGAILEALAPDADPYPTRTFPEPIPPGDPAGMLVSAAESSIPPRWRNRPGRYHNGAVWPYIGGFHVEAVAATWGADAARPLLDRLAAANALDDWSFPEWIGLDGEPSGARLQAWNAGTFVLAYLSIGGA